MDSLSVDNNPSEWENRPGALVLVGCGPLGGDDLPPEVVPTSELVSPREWIAQDCRPRVVLRALEINRSTYYYCKREPAADASDARGGSVMMRESYRSGCSCPKSGSQSDFPEGRVTSTSDTEAPG